MTGDPLPDADHVSRYCKPSAVASDGLPKVAAFLPRDDEGHLSVNWLEYLDCPDLGTAVESVRSTFQAKGYGLRPTGRFAVLEVGAVKTAAAEGLGRRLRIHHLPLEDDRSHAGILGYTIEDLAVAVELRALVRREHVHPAVSGG